MPSLLGDPIHICLAEVRKVAPIDRKNRPNVVGEFGQLGGGKTVPERRHRTIAPRQGHPQRFDSVGHDFDQIDAAGLGKRCVAHKPQHCRLDALP